MCAHVGLQRPCKPSKSRIDPKVIHFILRKAMALLNAHTGKQFSVSTAILTNKNMLMFKVAFSLFSSFN